MYGAILGDIIGSRFEFDRGGKTKDFELLTTEDKFTDSLAGHTFTSQDEVRMVPDILQSGDDFLFPVFTTAEEMGEYGDQFSKMQRHFLEAMILARNNEKNVKGIVINAFSEPFEIPVELFDIIAGIKSSVEDTAVMK